MKHTARYAFRQDGTLWTLINGTDWRPATVEELEGVCLERLVAPHPLPIRPEMQADEPMALPIAV